jgi:hypothetical protein
MHHIQLWTWSIWFGVLGGRGFGGVEWGSGGCRSLIILVTYLLASPTVKYSFSPSLRSPTHSKILYETEYVFEYAYKTNPTTQPSYLKLVT